LFIVWGSTALLQIPLHRRLEQGHDPVAILWLIRGNWIRTAAWTLRGLIVLALTPAVISSCYASLF